MATGVIVIQCGASFSVYTNCNAVFDDLARRAHRIAVIRLPKTSVSSPIGMSHFVHYYPRRQALGGGGYRGGNPKPLAAEAALGPRDLLPGCRRDIGEIIPHEV